MAHEANAAIRKAIAGKLVDNGAVALFWHEGVYSGVDDAFHIYYGMSRSRRGEKCKGQDD